MPCQTISGALTHWVCFSLSLVTNITKRGWEFVNFVSFLTFSFLIGLNLDGTTNFAHGYPSFSVSIGVLYHGKPAAATVVIVNPLINRSLLHTFWSKHQKRGETREIALFINFNSEAFLCTLPIF